VTARYLLKAFLEKLPGKHFSLSLLFLASSPYLFVFANKYSSLSNQVTVQMLELTVQCSQNGTMLKKAD
jgi:hypothetical protein